MWCHCGICLVGHGNLIPVTPSTSSVASSQLPDDVLKFYEDAGVDAFAREVGTLIVTCRLCIYTRIFVVVFAQ